MNESSGTPPTFVDIGARDDDLDPWGEFLSESSDEPAAPESARSSDDNAEGTERRRVAATELVIPLPDHTSPFPNAGEAVDTVGAATDAEEATEPISPPQLFASDENAETALADPRQAMMARPASVESQARPVSVESEAADGLPGLIAAPLSADATDAAAATADQTGTDVAPLILPEPRLSPRLDATESPASTALPPSNRSLSLADVVARQTPVRPDEAVAVVEELCAVLNEGDDPLIPGVGDILLTPAGSLIVRSGGGGDQDARSLGRMLNVLLASATTPLPLRLFISSSSSSGRYRTIAMFADALSDYASPQRTELIRGLYQRARELPAYPVAARMVVEPIIDVPAPVVSRRAPLWSIGVSAAVGAALVGAVSAWFWPEPAPAAALAAAAAPVPAATGREETPALEIVTARDGSDLERAVMPPARSATRGSVRTVSERPATARPSRTDSTAALPVALPAPAVERPRPTAETPSVSSGSAPAASAPPASALLVSRLTPGPTGAIPGVAPPFDRTVYSKDDLDVQPPVLLSPSQIPLSPPGLDDGGSRAVNTLELIIDERGVVERVTLQNRPQRLTDVGLPSAATMLRFRPAYRNGIPVRYKLRLPWTTAPG